VICVVHDLLSRKVLVMSTSKIWIFKKHSMHINSNLNIVPWICAIPKIWTKSFHWVKFVSNPNILNSGNNHRSHNNHLLYTRP
jgi:hypothetical protein